MDTTTPQTPTQAIQTNRNTTRSWGVGIIVTIVIQTALGIWFFATTVADLKSQTERNSSDIAKLQTGIPPLTRENVEDLLLVRDTRIDNIEKTQSRMESKLDRVLGYSN